MKKCDVIIIGGGILGCMASRTFSKYDLDICVLEKREDVACGMTKSNLGIVYSGYDMKPGSLKAKLCVQANQTLEQTCKELDVPFLRPGSLMLSFGPKGDSSLKKKYEDGLKNNINGLKLIDNEEIYELEPNIKKGATSALYSETTGLVFPFSLCIAAYENALANGVNFRFNEEVTNIEYFEDKLKVTTPLDTYCAKVVINCAGVFSDIVREFCNEPTIINELTHADYIVYDESASLQINHVIFNESEDKSNKFEIIPTLYTNLIVGATRIPWDGKYEDSTSIKGVDDLISFTKDMLPKLDQNLLVNQFGGLRNDAVDANNLDKHINDLCVLDDNGLISLIGVKTPGMTISEELAKYVFDIAKKYLKDVKEKPDFNPIRKAYTFLLNPAEYNPLIHGELVCKCNYVFEATIREAIRSGATTVNGVRRRTGACMGRCAGSYCENKIMDIIASELNIKKEDITKDGKGSQIIFDRKS